MPCGLGLGFLILLVGFGAACDTTKAPLRLEVKRPAQLPKLEEVKSWNKTDPDLQLVVIEGSEQPAEKMSAKRIVALTNAERSRVGSGELQTNELLSDVALEKLRDMINRDYFDHVSPLGIGPADLARDFGYDYLLTGENLAMGGFASEQQLVDAWMDSPGHRANILKAQYTEIGVAVEEKYEDGKLTWYSVQTFGTPRAVCPEADPLLLKDIEQSNLDLAELREALEEVKLSVEVASLEDPEEARRLLVEYNEAVEDFNQRASDLRQMVASYNEQVGEQNLCFSRYQ